MKLVRIDRLDCTEYDIHWVAEGNVIECYFDWDTWGDGSHVTSRHVGTTHITTRIYGEIRPGDKHGPKGLR